MQALKSLADNIDNSISKGLRNELFAVRRDDSKTLNYRRIYGLRPTFRDTKDIASAYMPL